MQSPEGEYPRLGHRRLLRRVSGLGHQHRAGREQVGTRRVHRSPSRRSPPPSDSLSARWALPGPPSSASACRLLAIDVPIEWVLFSLLTFASGMLMLKVPSVEAMFSISEVFAFSCVLLYGPEMGTVDRHGRRVLLSLRRRHSPQQTVFNVGNLDALCVGVGHALLCGLPACRRSISRRRCRGCCCCRSA